MFTKTQIAKFATTAIVGTGTTAIVSGIVKNNTDPENLAQEATIYAGSTVLGAMLADHVREYTDQKIDNAVAWWNANVKKN